jgi:DNA invertase Pin-like site-specific DNA recombinase
MPKTAQISAPLVPAAEYVRMSTGDQQYSIDNQKAEIQKYAEKHGFLVNQTHTDAGRSGVVIKHRKGLAELIQEVVSGKAEYKAVLVYDVSRWGRFQNTDESAHYEYLCNEAGIKVHYCAEQFANDGSLPSSIMKAMKRAMAGEYSRPKKP